MFNNVILVGRLTKKPELTPTSTGTSLCKFSLAVDRFSQGEKNTDFLFCTAFSKIAENMVNFLDKGSLILLNGSVQTHNYDDKNGMKKYSVDIVAQQVKFLEWGKKNTTEKNTESQNLYSSNNKVETINLDDELAKNTLDFSKIELHVPGEEIEEEKTNSKEDDAIVWDV